MHTRGFPPQDLCWQSNKLCNLFHLYYNPLSQLYDKSYISGSMKTCSWVLSTEQRCCFWEGASCEWSSNSEVKYLSGALDETQPCHSVLILPHVMDCMTDAVIKKTHWSDLWWLQALHPNETIQATRGKIQGKMYSWRQHVVNYFVCNVSRVCGASGGFPELLRLFL